MTKALCNAYRVATIALFAAGTFCSGVFFSGDALAQTYPTKPVRFVVASSPGAGPDIIARMLGAKLAEALGQQIIVDNRPGASGRIAAEAVARAVPDGYTLLMMTSQLATVEAMYKDLKYNLIKDFAPVSQLGTSTSVLVVNPSVPATSVKELITLAKSRPGDLKYGSGGSGSPPHLLAEVFNYMTGTQILHVPYKASPAAVINAVSGEVDISFQVIPSILPMVKSGKLRALAVTSAKRTPLLPETPAIAETVPGYDYILFQGLLAPAKTPPAILSRLNAEIAKALNTPALREQLTANGYEHVESSPQGFALFINAYVEKMREAIKLSGTRPAD